MNGSSRILFCTERAQIFLPTNMEAIPKGVSQQCRPFRVAGSFTDDVLSGQSRQCFSSDWKLAQTKWLEQNEPHAPTPPYCRYSPAYPRCHPAVAYSSMPSRLASSACSTTQQRVWCPLSLALNRPRTHSSFTAFSLPSRSSQTSSSPGVSSESSGQATK
jgi:hypothetical protein